MKTSLTRPEKISRAAKRGNCAEGAGVQVTGSGSMGSSLLMDPILLEETLESEETLLSEETFSTSTCAALIARLLIAECAVVPYTPCMACMASKIIAMILSILFKFVSLICKLPFISLLQSCYDD